YASCYCRYSSDKQQQQSIEYQLERIEEFCQKHDIILIEKYIDEATTGTNDHRSDFQRMIQDSEHSKWGYLLVYNLSRLARNVEDQMFYQKILKQRGIMIISVEEKFDSSPEGHLFALITAGINEYYSKHLAKRSFAGVMQKARKGLATGGKPPLGFDVDNNKQYIINQKEAEAVRIIFEKTLEGWSHRKIKEYLNENEYKTKRGLPFSQSFIEILRNRKYIGEYAFNKTTKKKSRTKRSDRPNNEDEVVRIPGGLPRIVDEETFEKVQHLLNKRSNTAKLEFTPSKYLLTGIIECGVCHTNILGMTSYNNRQRKPNIRYAHKMYNTGKCVTKEIPSTYMDNWILQFVIPNFIESKNIPTKSRSINIQISEEKSKIKNDIAEIQNQLTSIDEQLESQANSLVKSSFSLFALEEVASIKDQQGKLRREQRELEKKRDLLNRITNDKLEVFLNKARKRWNEADSLQEKQTFIIWLISKITVTNEKIVAHINYDTITKRLCDFDIEIERIEREKMMTFWRKY
ncbi:MAG: recombinase family protein, partial [Acholeplasmataceae bacterium]|nr:recombinase family protein [Acholeplasmataceae bacterium]